MSDDVLNLLISNDCKTNWLKSFNFNEVNYDTIYSQNSIEENYFLPTNNKPNFEIIEYDQSNNIKYEFLQNKSKDLDFDQLKTNHLLDFNAVDPSLFSNSISKDFNFNKINQQDPFTFNLEIPQLNFKYEESNYNEISLKQIKEKLDSNLKETENLIRDLKNTQTLNPVQISTFFENDKFHKSNESYDYEIDQKSKTKKANESICEFKRFYETFIYDIQQSFKTILEEKDKVIQNNVLEMNQLKNEAELLKNKLSDNQLNSYQNDSTDILKIKSLEETFLKIRNILIDEGNKKGLSYIEIEQKGEDTFLKENLEKNIAFLSNGLIRCLQDYREQIRNSETLYNEMKLSFENKLNACKQKEKDLKESNEKKFEILRQEYDRLIDKKQNEIKILNKETNDLNLKINQLKDDLEKKLNFKDKEIKKTKNHNETLTHELESLNKEFGILKKKFESINKEEKKNKMNTYNSIVNLENENKRLNSYCIQLTKNITEYQQKYEIIKEDLNKNEMYIENLSKKIQQEICYKKEIELDDIENEKTFDAARIHKNEPSSKCQELEKIIEILKNEIVNYQNCKKVVKNLNKEKEKNQKLLNLKTEEFNQIKLLNEQYENQIKTQNYSIERMKIQKSEIEFLYNKTLTELNDEKKKLDNTKTKLDQITKENALINDEKKILENMLNENSLKMETLNQENKKMFESNSNLKNQIKKIEEDFEILNNNFQEKSKLYDMILGDKEKLDKKLIETQNNFKTINKNLSETLTDKNFQIKKLEDSILLLEKEINLLKQYENLQKNQGDSKIMEFAMAIEQKMKKKCKKIEDLKYQQDKLNLENDSLKKINQDFQINFDKIKLENKNLKEEIKEIKDKNSHLEKTLEKSVQEYVECEKEKECLRHELLKFKNKLNNFNLVDEINKINQQLINTKDAKQNIKNNIALEKIFELLFSCKIKSENLNISIQSAKFFENEKQMNSESNVTENYDNEHFSNSSGGIDSETFANIENGFQFLNYIGNELRKDTNDVIEILKQRPNEA